MSLRKLRTQDHYKAITRELVAAGLRWREEFRGKHAALVISVNGREENEILSITPSDRRAMKNSVGHIRRRIKQWTAEAASFEGSATPAEFPTLEKETVVDTTFEIALHEIDGEPRALDTDIADRLGFARPTSIRVLIERNRDEIERFGPLHRADAKSSGGRPSSAYWLTEEQALTVAALSNADRAADVRHMLIKVFVAWRRGQLQAPEGWERVVGMMKMLARKTTENEKALADIQNYLTNPGGALVPSFDFAGSVTALEIITLAGVRPDQRVRGTSAAVTLRMKDFCLSHGYTALQTPVAIDASSRWRFPREAAQQWLYGEHHGAEFIHSHIRARKGDSTPDMFAVIKGGKR